ncbi:hypothetical protein GJ629_00355 [Halapricum sp. CBA1109]|uniref:DUF7521 family protein n=1 Tax=Halapricum sp. CBA1109 TaxID=2668068 RepID=UPI0012F8F19A|nr:hypothetical protein [Halapricum sp. CBA1109]MUV88524.1 hypothetical protein [Halapricum sp. CBA1109]
MIQPPILLAKLITLVLSLVVASLAYHGYRRSDRDAMRYVAAGFLFIGVGAICESLVYQVLGTSLLSAALLQAALVSGGLLLILASLTFEGDTSGA